MDEWRITEDLLAVFGAQLAENEKSGATISKYMRDVRRFAGFAAGAPVTRQMVLGWKEQLARQYAAASVNSMLAAVNALLRFAGWPEMCVRQLKIQRRVYMPEEKELSREEYERLVNTARGDGNERLELILQTIGSTGIRISELPYITVEAARRGEAVVRLKGKTRCVLLVRALRRRLLAYAQRRGISSGPVFLTRGGKVVNRTAVWREMKALCSSAQVPPGKVFPHNLRHLFARIFHGIDQDIARLADVLGHSSINTTRIYIASTSREHYRSMERMQLITEGTEDKKTRRNKAPGACEHNCHYVACGTGCKPCRLQITSI